MSWQPDDAQLDAIAREMPAPDAERARAEEMRTSLLASVASRPQLSRRSRAPWIAVGAALAAAAAVVVWIGVRPSAPTTSTSVAGKRQAIMAIGKATFTRGDWPDYIVKLDDGRIGIEVATVQTGERFRVITSDAEVEVRGTKFEVAATHGLIAEVAVREGRVEVRAEGRVIVLASGETWTATHTARNDLAGSDSVATAEHIDSATDIDTKHIDTDNHGDAVKPSNAAKQSDAADAAKHGDAMKTADTRASDAKHGDATKHDVVTRGDLHIDANKHGDAAQNVAAGAAKHNDTTKAVDTKASDTKHIDAKQGDALKHDSADAAKPVDVAAAPKPGEDEFRAGWTALRSGDAAAATKLFTSACSRAASDALGEDACFWAGAAAKRANDTKSARTALTRFLDRFPASARAPEASALLGWILYDANELDAAEAQFHKAEHDKVPKVRDSATKGLEAITRKRSQ